MRREDQNLVSETQLNKWVRQKHLKQHIYYWLSKASQAFSLLHNLFCTIPLQTHLFQMRHVMRSVGVVSACASELYHAI